MTNTTNSKRRRRMAREPQPTADAQPNARSETSAAKRIPPPIYEKGLSKTDKALALLRRQGGATPQAQRVPAWPQAAPERRGSQRVHPVAGAGIGEGYLS